MRKLLYSIILISPLIAIARDVNLAWDAPTDMAGITSYELRYGTSQGNYTSVLDIPLPSLAYTVTGLEDTLPYYFVIRSKSTDPAYGQYSTPSNEVSITALIEPTPTPTPAPTGNIATAGTAYKWANMSSITANTNLSSAPELNDLAMVDLNLNGMAPSATYTAGGIIWDTPKNITSVNFTNGNWDASGDGSFTANLQLQFTTNGTTWTNSGCTITPAYSYDENTANVKYTSTCTGTSILGFRFVGQVRTTTQSSYWVNMKEIEAYSQSTPPIVQPVTGLRLIP